MAIYLGCEALHVPPLSSSSRPLLIIMGLSDRQKTVPLAFCWGPPVKSFEVNVPHPERTRATLK